MSYFYEPYNNSSYGNELSLWDIIEALQSQAAQQQPQAPDSRRPSARPTAGRPSQSRIPFASSSAAATAAAATPPPHAPPARPSVATASAAVPSSSSINANKSLEKTFSPFVVKRAPRTDVFLPSLDVYDISDAYKVYASVPGAKKTSIEVHFNPDSNELTVEGEVPPPNGIKLDAYGQSVSTSSSTSDPQLLLSERESGAFARTLHFPADPKVDDERITAKFNAGVLEITIPKRTGSAPSRRKITVEDVEDEELISEAQQPDVE